MEKRDDIIEITDENGSTFEVEIVDMVNVEGQEYAILAPTHKCDEENCDCDEDYVLMKVLQDGEEFSLETIEDDEEFEKVAAYIDELTDEIDD